MMSIDFCEIPKTVQTHRLVGDDSILGCFDNAKFDAMLQHGIGEFVNETVGGIGKLLQARSEPAKVRGQFPRGVGAVMGRSQHYDASEIPELHLFKNRSSNDATHAVGHQMKSAFLHLTVDSRQFFGKPLCVRFNIVEDTTVTPGRCLESHASQVVEKLATYPVDCQLNRGSEQLFLGSTFLKNPKSKMCLNLAINLGGTTFTLYRLLRLTERRQA